MAFFVARVVGVFDFDGDFVAGVFGFQGVTAAAFARNRLAVALPLVFDFAGVELVIVVDFGGQFFAHFGVAADSDAARMVLARLWRLWCRGAVGDFGSWL